MNIIKQTYGFLQNEVFPVIPLRHRPLFSFGIKALTLQNFVSLNSNARRVVANRSTAESKIFRLVSNQKILGHFTVLLNRLGLVKLTETVNVDFSSFGGFEILTFAKQTRLGRALPLFFNTIRYPVAEHSQTIFVINQIKAFKDLLGFCPGLVFDRGFESPYIVPFLVGERITFYLRLKKDKHVVCRGKEIPLRNLPWYEKDCLVSLYGQDLRMVVSEKLSEKKNSDGNEESWYILTNDFVSTREQMIAKYYFRFEIEETFKDLKHINNLKNFFAIKKSQTLKILLWFCILAIWLAFLLPVLQEYLINRIKQKKRKKLSVIRYLFEQIELVKTNLVNRRYAM